MIYKPYKYQEEATQWVIEHKRCCLFMQMGLGKSIITLTAIRKMIDDCEVTKVLVVAPKKVAETTWTSEADKWDHIHSLKVVRVMGDLRHRVSALKTNADIYVLGRDSFVWLMGFYNGRMPFDMLVIDELTSFKSHSSQRFKAMKKVTAQFDRVVGLTGTPAPNGLLDLWAEIYCIDLGERLGKFFTKFRDGYFDIYVWNNIPVRCTPKKGAAETIKSKLKDICLTMQSKDYITLPPMIIKDERITLAEKTYKQYTDFEKDKVMEFKEQHEDSTSEILASSAAALLNKLAQFSNGAIYDEEHGVHDIHSEKLDKLKEIVEAAQSPVLVYYQYQFDIDRIKTALKGYKTVKYEDARQLEEWNEWKIDVLLAHPASTAYGLNMQQGGHYIVWFGTGFNLELYQQANARLHRQGQTMPVVIYRLICSGTVDERAVAALDNKKTVQQGLMDGLDYLMKKYKDEVKRVD